MADGKPKQSFTIMGRRPARPEQLRIRNRFIFGAVVEQLWEDRSGVRFWRRLGSPVALP